LSCGEWEAEECFTVRKSSRLPTRFPVGSKYILEGRGPTVRRYIEFPNGRRVLLPTRKALSCTCAASQEVSIAPGLNADGDAEPVRKDPAAAARKRARAPATT
jgi:hypothetical protein